MKYLLPSLLCVGAVVAACTASTASTNATGTTTPDAITPATPDEDAAAREEADAAVEAEDAAPAATPTADGCLMGQDMDAADVDISLCPALPSSPARAKMNGKTMELGAWEIGTASDGKNYLYGSLSAPGTDPRVLSYDDGAGVSGKVPVNALNVECWAKGYYRLRQILQAPPAAYVALKDAGFQFRFFQFQTDLRNGPTGYKQISSFQDHLVKWVTIIGKDGVCTQPTFTKFKTYATSELRRRSLAVPAGE